MPTKREYFRGELQAIMTLSETPKLEISENSWHIAIVEA